jgi:hypothetical protein
MSPEAMEKQKEMLADKLVQANRELSRAKGMVSVLLPMVTYIIFPLMPMLFVSPCSPSPLYRPSQPVVLSKLLSACSCCVQVWRRDCCQAPVRTN